MRRESLHLLLIASVLVPTVTGAQRPVEFTGVVTASSELGNSSGTEPLRPLDRIQRLAVLSATPRAALSASTPAAAAAARQFGGESDSSLPLAISEHRRSQSALHMGELSGADTTTQESNRHMHIVIGAVVGLVAGVMLGKTVDKGTAGCGHEQSGLTCTWGSGLYVPVFGLTGFAIGGVVGALLPHN